jgi:hypothetical protein
MILNVVDASLSDQIRAIADEVPPLTAAKLRLIAVQVRRGEVTLDELVSEAIWKQQCRPMIKVHSSPHGSVPEDDPSWPDEIDVQTGPPRKWIANTVILGLLLALVFIWWPVP